MIVVDRDRPHMAQHAQSVTAKAEAERVMPRGLHGLLAWLSHHWQAEMPEAIHGSGPFVGPPGEGLSAERSRPSELVGGSLLGSPRYSDPFRAYLEGRSTALDGQADVPDAEGAYPAYRFPVHAALYRMAGRDPDSHDAHYARIAWELACAGRNWQAVARRRDYSEADARVIFVYVLRRLWRLFEVRPPAREVAG